MYSVDHPLPLSTSAARLLSLDNYGLGSTASTYSDLAKLAFILIEKLEPYYSPDRVSSEEFQYEAYSWVTLQSLLPYLEPLQVQNAFECTNTVERMEAVYDGMLRHKLSLQELAQAKIQELADCGEECTDLF